MDKKMIKKYLVSYCAFIGLILFTGVVIAKGSAHVSIGSIDMIYDIRINGMPVIKNPAIRSRSLLVPIDIYLKEGKNRIEINFMGAHLKNEKLIKDLSDRSLIRLGLRINEKRYEIVNIVPSEEKASVNLNTLDGNEVKIDSNFSYDGALFLIGSNSYNSTLVGFDVYVDDYETKEIYWLDGEKIEESDYAKLKDAYIEAHNYIVTNRGDSYMRKMTPYYRLLADYYYKWPLEKTLNEQSKNFQRVDSNGAVIQDLDFSKSNMDIFADGHLARMLLSPLTWKLGDTYFDMNLVFKKINNKFIPVFMSNDNSF